MTMVDMINALVSTQATDHNQQCSSVTVSEQAHTGNHGCLATEIDPIALQQLLELRGPEDTGKLLGCSTHTVQ